MVKSRASIMDKRATRRFEYNSWLLVNARMFPPFMRLLLRQRNRAPERFWLTMDRKQQWPQSSPASRNLINLLSTLPPESLSPAPRNLTNTPLQSSMPSPTQLRRTVSDPLPFVRDTSKEEMRKITVTVKEWDMSNSCSVIKVECGCGSKSQFMVNSAKQTSHEI